MVMEVGALTRRGEKVKLKPDITPTEFEDGIAVDRMGPAAALHEACSAFWFSFSPFAGSRRPYVLGTMTVAGIEATGNSDVCHVSNIDIF
jgi:hypothetical protein